MGKHSGDPVDEEVESAAAAPTASVDRRRLLLSALGLTLTLVAWGLLVWLAIDFGTQARTGSTLAWVFLLLATLGATACLFLSLTLGAKLVSVVRGEEPAAPPARSPGGKRAAR